jgi:hypothetical protein
LFKQKKEIGVFFKVNEYLEIYPNKMKNFNQFEEVDYIFGYGETSFSNSCITCHDPQNIDLIRWDSIEKKEKPSILILAKEKYYFVPDSKFHWNFALMNNYEKNGLKQYIKGMAVYK